MLIVLDKENDDDVVGDVGVVVSVVVGSVGVDGALDGLRFIRYHYRGGVAIIVTTVVVASAVLSSLLLPFSVSLLLHDLFH